MHQRTDWQLISERTPNNEMPRESRSHSQRDDYYQILDVLSTADASEIRKAYRSLALKWHPDVNDDENADSIFMKIRKAYGTRMICAFLDCRLDVLSNPKSRSLYDRFGAEGMESMKDAHAGDGNADRFWDEFKPFKKENRKTKARTAGMYVPIFRSIPFLI